MDMFLISAIVFFIVNLVIFGVMVSRIDLENPILIKNEQAARIERIELRRKVIIEQQLKTQSLTNVANVELNNIISN